MLILSKSNASLKQCVEWAKSKKATELYMELVPKLYAIAEKEGVNPVLAIVQCAKETGYCRFGGVLDASFKNTCGLKTPQGGSCTDPDAHTRFATWEDGILAQVQHLALYAGKEGYPLTNPLDPRHFGYLLGKCKTVESLSNNWAGGTYGQDLVKMMKEVESIKVDNTIDYTAIIKEKDIEIKRLKDKLNNIKVLATI